MSVHRLLRVDDVEQAAEPVIDHAEFCAVVGADVIAPRAAVMTPRFTAPIAYGGQMICSPRHVGS